MVAAPGRLDPTRVGVAVLSLVGGLLVLFVAVDLFPYLSSNHDEGVYLQHARILLSGRLWLTTSLPETFQHWFFVRDGTRLYSKYQPVVPAMFAVGIWLGTPRIVLAGVAVGVVALVGLLAHAAYDGRHAVVASALVVASPLFLLTTATFLPYAPTALLNLVFAYAYVRTQRAPPDRTIRWATIAGVAIGLAFFARPYTAVLFALPFIGHVAWRLATVRRRPTRRRHELHRTLPIAAFGLAFVALSLAYNAVVTGNPVVFPYQAFAPADGIGFGHRELLGYDRIYTPWLGLRTTAHLLWEFATRWTVAAPLGAIAALAGATLVVIDRSNAPESGSETRLPDATVRWLFLGVSLSVILGNVAFWGILNALGDLGDPTDGFVAQFGPFYHYDLLLPLSVFAAAGLLAGGERAWGVLNQHLDRRTAVVVALALTLVCTPVAVVAEAGALGPPIAENREYTERYAQAYDPMTDVDGVIEPPEGVVLIPTPYGPWLGHPFQALFNDADLHGETVYALDRGADSTFAVVAMYPNRDLHRFTYRGTWNAHPRGEIIGTIQHLEVRRGVNPTVTFETAPVGRPSTVRLADGDEAVTYRMSGRMTGSVPVKLRLDRVGSRARARIASPALSATRDDAIMFHGSDDLSVAVTYVQAGGATVTYRLELAAEVAGDGVRVIWPPVVKVCRLTPDCGHEGTYLPGRGDYLTGVYANATFTSAGTAR